MSDIHRDELLACVIATLLDGLGHVAVGARSPLPAAAALLARERGEGRPRVSLLGAEHESCFTDGGRELFDCAAQGRIDAFFLGGGQIAGNGDINLVGIGDYPHSRVRFAGSFGSAYLYFVVPRVVLFTLEHSRRVLVPAVDFVSAPGTSPPGVYRPGGPVALVTPRCVFVFDRARGRFRLDTLLPGESIASIAGHTGFDYDLPATGVSPAAMPDTRSLALLRGPVARALASSYPAYAARVFGIGECAEPAD